MHCGAAAAAAAGPAVAFCLASGAFKSCGRSFQTPLKGIMAADCEASKGRKREMIDGRSQ